MDIHVSWKSNDIFVVGYLTGGPDNPSFVDGLGNPLNPGDQEVNLFIQAGLTEEVRAIIAGAEAAGYRVVPRDDSRMPAPRFDMGLQIAPGTEGE